MKSELAIKRDEWFESEEGKKCCAAGVLGRGVAKEYLKNRLEAAFLAGANATHEIAEELAEKIIG